MHLGGLDMTLIKYRLGDFIQQRREKYDGIEDLPSWGVSRDGFISPKQDDADTSIYNVFYKNDFVFNPARMELNSIALNNQFDKAICSSLYEIFYISRPDIVLPEYLNLFIKRDEFARKCWFEAIGSARNYFRVANLSEFEIDLPPLSIQQKYVDIFNAIFTNQQSYEHGLEDLSLAINAQLDKLKYSSPLRAVGSFLKEIDNRNETGAITDVQGINITKQFMPSVADTLDVNLKKYKVVRHGQFAYSGMQTGRDQCIRIALFHGDTPIIISPAYTVLETIDKSVLPEYILMWFTRSESDRRGAFMSDGSIRSNLDLDRFYETEIPVPMMDTQRALVDLYTAYTDRRAINARLKKQIKELCPILIKGAIEESQKEA